MLRNAFLNIGAYALVITSPIIIAAVVYGLVKSIKFDAPEFDMGNDDLECVSNGFDLH